MEGNKVDIQSIDMNKVWVIVRKGGVRYSRTSTSCSRSHSCRCSWWLFPLVFCS